MARMDPTIYLKRWEIRFWIFRVQVIELPSIEMEKGASNREADTPFLQTPIRKERSSHEKE